MNHILWVCWKNCRRFYWAWRLSVFSYPYYVIKAFLFIQYNATKTSIILDECLKAMGQMKETDQLGIWLMKESIRRDLVSRGYKHLPNFKWQ